MTYQIPFSFEVLNEELANPRLLKLTTKSSIFNPLTQPTYPDNNTVSFLLLIKFSGSNPPIFTWKYSVGGAGGLCGDNIS